MNIKTVTKYFNMAGGMKDKSQSLDAAWINFWFWRIQQAELPFESYKLEKYLFGFGLMMGKPHFMRLYNYIPPDYIPERNRGQKKQGHPVKPIIISWRWPMSFMVFYKNHQFVIPNKARLKRDFHDYHSWD